MMLLEKREQKRETEATAIVICGQTRLAAWELWKKRQAKIWLSSHSFQTIFSGVRATQKKAEQQSWESWSLGRAVRFVQAFVTPERCQCLSQAPTRFGSGDGKGGS